MVFVSEAQPREDEASLHRHEPDVGKPAREAAGSLGYYPRMPDQPKINVQLLVGYRNNRN